MTGHKITASVGTAMNGHDEVGRGEPRLARSEKSAGMDIGMRVLSYLIGGVALYGFLGTGFLLPTGIVLGAGLGCYVIIRRFGAVAEPSMPPKAPTVPTGPADDRRGAR